MKIVYCIEGTFNSGGMEKIILDKANFLDNLGHEVVVVTVNERGRPTFFPLNEGIRQIDLNINYDLIDNYSIVKKWYYRRKKLQEHKRKLQALINDLQPDIFISTFGSEIEFIHEFCGKSKTKIMAEIHFARNYRLYNQRKTSLKYYISKYLTNRYNKLAGKLDAFVCLTEEDKKDWGNLSNLHVIPNFVVSKADKPAKLENKQIISFGRLTYQKGYDRLIEAWKIVNEKYPDWKLSIFGEGELKHEIEELVNNLNLADSVSLNEPTHKVYENLQNSSIYVMSSRFEGLPMVLLESMACGLPIVSYACKCGPRDLIENKGNGILVEDGDIKGLSDAMIQYIEDEEARKSSGAVSYKEIDNYMRDNVMNKWINLFNNLVSD